MLKIGGLPGSWRAKHDRIPPELVKTLYARVLELAMKDSSPVSIARQLSASYSLSLAPGTVRHWIVGDRKPGAEVRNVFKKKPSPALSYIIGANKGDGCTLAKSGMVKLEVTDKDFAQTFNACLATLFSRLKPNTILVRRRVDRLPIYIVKYASRPLVRLLRQPLKRLLRLASAFPGDFLRGFFDAEGHVDVTATVTFSVSAGVENSNVTILAKIKTLLLTAFQIAPKINRKRESGSPKTIRGKSFIMRKTSFSLMIRRFSDLQRFSEFIGFSISRKNQKLLDALMISMSYSSKERPAKWQEMYTKRGGEWVKR